MKFSFKNCIILLIVGLMILGIIMPIFAESKPPYSDENYWNNKCEGFGFNENQSDCMAFKKFILDRINSNNDSLVAVEADLSSIRANIKKYADEVAGYEAEIKLLESQGAVILDSIRSAEIEIEKLENQIAERLLIIEEKEQRVKDYIALSQSQMRVNGYIEFIMGAKDFSEIIMRMEGLNRIKIFNEGLIEELKLERISLEEDKESVENQKELMVIEKDILDSQIVYAASLKEASNALMDQLHVLELEAEAKADQISTTISMDKEKSDALKMQTESQVPSSSWTNPIRGSYFTTNRGWYYTNGVPHNGTDLAVSIGTPIVSVGNGIVATTQDGCGNGYLGNSCGYAYGNRVSTIVNIDGVIYGIVNAHLLAGTINVSRGSLISAGQVLGMSGNSGSSTGPHFHIEIIRFAEDNIVDAYQNWGNSMNFGTLSASASNRRICAFGYSEPCRIDPADIFGY